MPYCVLNSEDKSSTLTCQINSKLETNYDIYIQKYKVRLHMDTRKLHVRSWV